MQNTSDTASSKEPTHACTGDKNGVNEFKKMLIDIEELLKSAGSLSGDDLIQLNRTIMKRINSTTDFFADKEREIMYKFHDTNVRANIYVHKHPWRAIGLGLALGALFGFLLAPKETNKEQP